MTGQRQIFTKEIRHEAALLSCDIGRTVREIADNAKLRPVLRREVFKSIARIKPREFYDCAAMARP